MLFEMNYNRCVKRGVAGLATEAPLERVAEDVRRFRLGGRNDEAAEATFGHLAFRP